MFRAVTARCAEKVLNSVLSATAEDLATDDKLYMPHIYQRLFLEPGANAIERMVVREAAPLPETVPIL